MNAARVSVVMAVSLALLAACTPGPVAPSPSPTPTTASAPAETQLERQTRLDYEAAEKAYRTFLAEVNRVFQAGGSTSATRIMKQTAAGDYLKFYTATATNFAKNHAIQTGRVAIARVTPNGYSTDELLLRVCEDGRKISVKSPTKNFGGGELREGTLTARKIDGVWKIWKASDKKVDACS